MAYLSAFDNDIRNMILLIISLTSWVYIYLVFVAKKLMKLRTKKAIGAVTAAWVPFSALIFYLLYIYSKEHSAVADISIPILHIFGFFIIAFVTPIFAGLTSLLFFSDPK